MERSSRSILQTFNGVGFSERDQDHDELVEKDVGGERRGRANWQPIVHWLIS